MKVILLLTIVLLPSFVAAAEWKPIEGIYSISSESEVVNADEHARKTHYRIQLKGKSARDLYEMMRTKTVIDECTGALARNMGEMQCLFYKQTSKYECHFSIQIETQKIEYGVSC